MAVAAALVAASISGLSSQPVDRTFVAVVRQDGSLVPIAIRDGGRWWNRWPWASEADAEIKALEVPSTIGAVPANWLPPGVSLPSEWTLLTGSGPQIRILATRPVRPSEWDLMATIAIQSNYQRRATDDLNAEELGVAVAGLGELGGFRAATELELQQVLRQLSRRLALLEREAIAGWQKERKSRGEAEISLTPSRRSLGGGPPDSTPFHITLAIRPHVGLTYAHFTGEKLYDMDVKGECSLNLSFDGIVITRTDGTIMSESVSAHPYGEYCGDAAAWMTPLATLHWNGRVLWVVKDSVEDGYNYALIDPTGKEDVRLQGLWELRR
jgi:hypothetical protein